MTALRASGNQQVLDALTQGRKDRRRYAVKVMALLAGLVVAGLLALSAGSVAVPLSDVWATIAAHLSGTSDSAGLGADVIIWDIRLPRVVMAALVGAGLAVIGVAVQAMVRNPLADPYVLGVENGAAAGAVAVIYLAGPFAAILITPAVGAFIGAMATLLLVFALARSGGHVSSVRLLLVGVSLAFGLSGFTSFVLYSSRDPAAQAQVLFWILGSFGGVTWSQIPLVLAAVVIGAALFWYYARPLNALALGDQSAQALGISADRLRVVLFVISAVMIAAIVSTVGPIGFVGLIIPHVARMMVGADHRRVVPVSLLLGAIYLTLVDLVSRVIFAPGEVPVGVVTAMLGTPFFLWLLKTRGSRFLMDGS